MKLEASIDKNTLVYEQTRKTNSALLLTGNLIHLCNVGNKLTIAKNNVYKQ